MPSPDHATHYQLFVGVDIAAATATVAWQRPQQKPSKPLTLEQTLEGFSSLHQRLISTGARPDQILVVMEVTFFARQGYAISVVNPSQAHHFAKVLLKHAKTDAIDAQTLTQLAAFLQPDLWTPPRIYEELEQRLSQRESLLLMQGQLRNQLHALTHNPIVVSQVRQRMGALDQTLTAQIAEIEAELAALVVPEDEQINADAREDAPPEQAWAKNIARLQTIPDIGLLSVM